MTCHLRSHRAFAPVPVHTGAQHLPRKLLDDSIIAAQTEYIYRVEVELARIDHEVVDGAIEFGQAAINTNRQSIPSRLMVTRDLTSAIQQAAPDVPQVVDYLERVRELGRGAA